MTSECSGRLSLRWTASVTSLGSYCIQKDLGTVQMEIQSNYDTATIIHVKACILPTILTDTPTRPLLVYLREICSYLSLVDLISITQFQ